MVLLTVKRETPSTGDCFFADEKRKPSPGKLDPPTFRLPAERANRLHRADFFRGTCKIFITLNKWIKLLIAS